MPEGHSIRRLALAFRETFVGQVCQLSSPQGRFDAGAGLLDGHMMVAADTHGKHLFLGFAPNREAGPEDTLWLHVHLGLYGAWRFQGAVPPTSAVSKNGLVGTIGAPRRTDPDEAMSISWEDGAEDWQPPAPRGAVRARILTENCVADLTGPTRCEVITDLDKIAVGQRLGPDPLHGEQQGLRKDFVARVRKSRRAVGELVMDQAVVAGVGNIYRAEGLFRQGISPFRPGSAVSERRLSLLWDDFVELLELGVTTGNIFTLRIEDLAEDIPEDDPESDRWYVYHRAGRPCLRCGAPIQTKQMQGRTLFWCQGCQR